MATQDDYIRTALRVPPELHAQIHASAKANNRTFNAEIVARLQESFHVKGAGVASLQLEAAGDANILKSFERSNLENRLMELLTQRSYENTNLLYCEDRLEYLEDDHSEDAKFERHILEHDRSATLRKLGALDEAINATYAIAQQKGIDLDPEEINLRGK